MPTDRFQPIESDDAAADKSVVLLVDDCQDQSGVIEILLRKHGYEVRTAQSVEEAVTLLRTAKIDIIVSDIFMPGKSGKELIAFVSDLKTEHKRPFIALTAAAHEIREELLKAGADGFVHKTNIRSQLPTLIGKLLLERSS